jgi:septal ring factor EnvC (AmiA/AmiB activator)
MFRGWALGGLVLGLSAGLLPMSAHAQSQVTEIFKCRNESGQVTYTNDRRKAEKQKCELVTSQINVAPSKAPAAARPQSFPRETSRDSVSARERQREILERELAAERSALDQARQALAEQEATRSGDERNYARVQERLQPFKATIENHEKNIQALQRELGNLK